jgi:hypothetical protein
VGRGRGAFRSLRRITRVFEPLKASVILQLMHQPESIGRNDVSERDLFLLSVPRVSDVPGVLRLSSEYFGVLLACDAHNITDDVVVDLARSLIANGMRYFCSWGRDCERVHDIVDSVVIENAKDETEDSVIITMWFDDKSLDEALWQFLYVAFPANDYAEGCRADLAIVIGNSEWGGRIKRRVSNLDDLNKDVLGEEEESDGEPAISQTLAADASVAWFLRRFLATKVECLSSARLKRSVRFLLRGDGRANQRAC